MKFIKILALWVTFSGVLATGATAQEFIDLSEVISNTDIVSEQLQARNTDEGQISLHVQSTRGKLSHIDFQYEKQALPNPYTVNHSYDILTLEDGSFVIDVDAFMDPLDVYLAETVQLEYTGGKFVLPSNILGQESFDNVTGSYTLTIPGVDDFNKRYDIQLNNITLSPTSKKNVNGQEYDAYKMSFDYVNSSSFNGTEDATKRHSVKGYLIPTLGFIQTERVGINDMKHTIVNHRSTSGLATNSRQ